MTLFQIWKRIGKQYASFTQRQEAYVFIRGRKYRIEKIRFDNGKWVGFEAKLVKEESEGPSANAKTRECSAKQSCTR